MGLRPRPSAGKLRYYGHFMPAGAYQIQATWKHEMNGWTCHHYAKSASELGAHKRTYFTLICQENIELVGPIKIQNYCDSLELNDKWNGDLDKVKMSVEMISSQILRKRFSEFPNGSRTHDLPEYRLERSNHWAIGDSWWAKSYSGFLCVTHVLPGCKAQICPNDKCE